MRTVQKHMLGAEARALHHLCRFERTITSGCRYFDSVSSSSRGQKKKADAAYSIESDPAESCRSAKDAEGERRRKAEEESKIRWHKHTIFSDSSVDKVHLPRFELRIN